MHRPMIMGRKTFESIGKPLEKRGNIVLTRKRDYAPQGALIAHDPDAAIALAEKWIQGTKDQKQKVRGEIIIFGGGEIYKMFLPFANQVEETLIDLEPEGDTYFDRDGTLERDWWPLRLQTVGPADGCPGYTRTLYRNINNDSDVPEYFSQAMAS